MQENSKQARTGYVDILDQPVALQSVATKMARLMPTVVMSVLTFASPKMADAALMDIFLIANHSAPSLSSTAPFSLETTKVYQLGDINSNNKIGSATLVDNFTFDIGQSLNYHSHKDRDAIKFSDAGEVGAGTASLFNSEISTWDDVGVNGGTIDGAGESDASNNLDFGRNASVNFQSVVGGFKDLIIAEDGGLNPFKLSLCPDALCSTMETVFSGFKAGVQNFLVNLPEFAVNDSNDPNEMDQAFLFRFSDLVTDYVQVTEFDDRRFYTNERLEIDFIGVGGKSSTDPGPDPNLSTVPLPAGISLLSSSLGFLMWVRGRRKSRGASLL